MKLINKKNQHRRDLDIDIECEGCGNKEEVYGAYDDRNYWDNVLPNRKCKKCKKSTKDLGIEPEKVPTKYAPYEIV